MKKPIYKPLEKISYKEAKELLISGTEEQLMLLPLRVGEYLECWKQAEDICIKLMKNENPAIRANAVLGLAYTVRTKGMLEKRIVKPYLIKELRENTEFKWKIVEALEDINLFLGWNIAQKELKRIYE